MATAPENQIPRLARTRRAGSTGRVALFDHLARPVIAALEEAADLIVGAGEEFALKPLNPIRVVLAFSGGRDSMAMLSVLAKLFHKPRQSLISRITAVYVNHGLSPNADSWQEVCREAAQKAGVGFESLKVWVNPKGQGVEAAAREARYRALAAYAKKTGADVVMTAHHEDDRLETFLLQWLRGAGPEGLAAFPQTRSLTSLGMSEGPRGQVLLVRPWCEVRRADIERWARLSRLLWVDDESNDDPRFVRNRVRHEVVPLLEEIRPGFHASAARSVSLVAEAVEVIRSVAQEDLSACRAQDNPHALSITKLLKLVPARQSWCLRAWMSEAGMRLPSRAKLSDALRQVRQTHSDTKLCIRVGTQEVRRWGELLVVRDVPVRHTGTIRDQVIDWNGELTISLPAWGGQLDIVPCEGDEPGLSRKAVLTGTLMVRSRRGGEKLKLWALRPSKNLKDHYQAGGIPSFERANLPLIWLNEELVFAAGLGHEIRALCDPELVADRVRFVWHPDASLLGVKEIENLVDKPSSKRRR